VRGIQLGLGISLASLALKNYVPALGAAGYVLAGACFLVIVLLWGNRRFPAALVVIALGLVYAAFTMNGQTVAAGVKLFTPHAHVPTWDAILTGLIVLALPQLPLSISNSVIATNQTLQDLFPERIITVRRIGLTYAAANVIAAFLGGVPVCHGCGGLAGHHAFGARTGGSVVIYGSIYLTLGLFFGGAVEHIVSAFPLPVLGVILLFEAAALMVLVRDVAPDTRGLLITMLVGMLAFGVTQGFVVGLLVGAAVFYLWQWRDQRRAVDAGAKTANRGAASSVDEVLREP
jgi:MFS superfamily sulfate permease-like transporter